MISLIIGFVIDLIIGDPQNPVHPVRIIGNLGITMEKFFRKLLPKRLKLAGLFTWMFVVITTLVITLEIVKFAFYINSSLGVIIEGILLYFCISAKGLKVEGLKVINVLKSGDIDGARKKLSYIVGRDTESLNEKSIVRAVIETVAENMSDGIIAPLFFAGIGGAPLAMAYKAVNTCDSMFGYKNEKYIDFGFVSAKLDDFFNYIPARLTGYFIIITSFILGLNYKESYRIYIRDRYNHTSPNSAHPEAAVAGALDIRLGGANYYFGKLVEKPTIGDNNEEIKIEHLYKTNKILFLVSFIGLLFAIILKAIGVVVL